MKARDFRRIALALSGVVESSHMNHPGFRVSGRYDEDTLGEAITLAWKNATPKRTLR